MLDPLMLLAAAAACTRRIELGTAVLVVTLRAAAVVARQVSTLHHLSGGRLALGLSLGRPPRGVRGRRRADEPPRHGVPGERRGGRGSSPASRSTMRASSSASRKQPSAGRARSHLRRRPRRGCATAAGELADGWIMSPFGTVRDFPRLWQAVPGRRRAPQGEPGRAGRGPTGVRRGRRRSRRARNTLRTFSTATTGHVSTSTSRPFSGRRARSRRRLGRARRGRHRRAHAGRPDLDLAHLRRVADEVAPVFGPERPPRDERASGRSGSRKRRAARALGPARMSDALDGAGPVGALSCTSLWVIHVGGRSIRPTFHRTPSRAARDDCSKKDCTATPSFSLIFSSEHPAGARSGVPRRGRAGPGARFDAIRGSRALRTAYDPPGPLPPTVPFVSKDGRRTLATVELRGTPAGFASLEFSGLPPDLYPSLRGWSRSETLDIVSVGNVALDHDFPRSPIQVSAGRGARSFRWSAAAAPRLRLRRRRRAAAARSAPWR